jgi:hypothetical protein
VRSGSRSIAPSLIRVSAPFFFALLGDLRAEDANITLMIQGDMLAYRAPGEPPQLGLPLWVCSYPASLKLDADLPRKCWPARSSAASREHLGHIEPGTHRRNHNCGCHLPVCVPWALSISCCCDVQACCSDHQVCRRSRRSALSHSQLESRRVSMNTGSPRYPYLSGQGQVNTVSYQTFPN